MQKDVVKSFILIMFAIYSLNAQPGQISIPRIDQMPDHPAPYNLRDWKIVALKYDSFVYDIHKTGQYLPVTSIIPKGINYPERETFRQHTYIGTFSPTGNEAINVLPSLVGATLAGIDKSNQFGKNWVSMAYDFFNKLNGENIYLNNVGASSGQDWWYDMMPNIYFYQLYDLYPNLGGEANFQFNSIADQFSKAVSAMGGSATPWKVPFMNYRGWKFKTMEPNTAGVPEPEAAGAFGWTLYHAWKQTGNPQYLKSAEWSMEFLNQWPSNPSYELQLPYGVYTAAKMNAEIGTNYNVEKMLNWCFNRGALRGWGSIIGSWGGLNVSGLIGEANDNGNDYAFQLNGVQQAAALVPMVRYDKRFAKAIGKWVLNLANANRLFFPGFLPAHLQDASAWSNAHDPDQVIGYEALREVWQGNSPFSTGDALRGGWGATNLALYGTGSTGYLGAIVSKTNVEKVLKLDLLKTDFYNDAAYPSFLFYNPFNTDVIVQFDPGSNPSDIYDAISEKFIYKDVNVLINLTIPAGTAMIAVVCPAGGGVSFDQNKMLVDGVIVDYRQNQTAYDIKPRIKALEAKDNPIQFGKKTSVYCTAEYSGQDTLTYRWQASHGVMTGSGPTVEFIAPDEQVEAIIQCIVTDHLGNADSLSITVAVVPKINSAPVIDSLILSNPYSSPSEVIQIRCFAKDIDDDVLSYSWTTDGGIIIGTGAQISWQAPAGQGIYNVSVTVSDDKQASVQSSVKILVKNFSDGSGIAIANYPFSGNANDISGNQLHGQVKGAILTADRKSRLQSAYYFNGGAQHIIVQNAPKLNFTEAITVCGWFNALALPEKENFILSHGSWQNRWKISITPDKYLRWTVNTTQTIGDLDSSIPLESEKHYHVCATYDQDIMALYLNGKLNNFRKLNGTIRTTGMPLLMGQMLPDQTDFNFKGTIDDILIFDYAISPSETEKIFSEGLSSLSDRKLLFTRNLFIHPNPTSHRIYISIEDELESFQKISIFDFTGLPVYSTIGDRNSDFEIDIEKLIPGLYTIKIWGTKALYSGRFIKI